MEENSLPPPITLHELIVETDCPICWGGHDGEPWEQCDNGHCFHSMCLTRHRASKRREAQDPKCPLCNCWLPRGARVLNRTQALLARTVPLVQELLATVADLETRLQQEQEESRELRMRAEDLQVQTERVQESGRRKLSEFRNQVRWEQFWARRARDQEDDFNLCQRLAADTGATDQDALLAGASERKRKR